MLVLPAGKEKGGGWLMLVIFLAYVASLGKGGWPTVPPFIKALTVRSKRGQ